MPAINNSTMARIILVMILRFLDTGFFTLGIDRGVGGLELAGLLVKIKGLGGSEKVLGGCFGGVGLYYGFWVGF